MKKKLPLYKDGRFYNVEDSEKQGGYAFSIVILALESLRRYFFDTPCKIAQSFAVQKVQFQPRSENPSITWLGHATFLIQVDNLNILTDPVFGGITWFFPRFLPAVVSIQNLPPIDYILLSHNHPDHMDRWSLRMIKKYHPSVKVLVPIGDKAWFDARNFNADEFMWWDECDLSSTVKATFLPALHWSQKDWFDKNKSLWGSWMIHTDHFKVYFAGDTAWSDHFAQIGQVFGSIDVALLPIGPNDPREWSQDDHITSEEAGEAMLQLNARHMIPMHWGTFVLGFDTFTGPLKRMHAWWKRNKKRCADKVLQVLKVGQVAGYVLRRRVVEKISLVRVYRKSGQRTL
jgi:L-ascorbate metabolism protein UlaG (beta-lactamase superfamily)